MDEAIKTEDIDRSHRLGKSKSSINGKPCPIIVKFVRYSTRNRIYINKKKLKGTGNSVTESLTVKRINMLEKAKKLIIVNFFFGNEPDQLWSKKNLLFRLQFYLEVFSWFCCFFYILTYYFY